MPENNKELRARDTKKFDQVPPFETYFPSVSDMNQEAKDFYKHWKSSWKQGNPIKIDGNVSYIYTYVYKILTKINQGQRKEVIAELKKLSQVYQYQKLHYLDRWAIDAYVGNQQFQEAWDYDKKVQILHGAKFWTVKRKCNTPLTGSEIISTKKLTDYGKANSGKVADELTKILRKFEEKNNVELTRKITKKANGSWAAYKSTNLSRYLSVDMYKADFSKAPNLFDSNLFREAENRAREKADIPKVGKGWVSETVLKNIISKLLQPTGYKVKQHAHPDWLKGQHLDVYLPDLDLGIEYMGKQHYQPVEHFGGEENLKENKKRDKKKKEKCDKNGVQLIYFRYDEPLEPEFVAEKLSENFDFNLKKRAKNIEVKGKEKLPTYSSARDDLDEAKNKIKEEKQKRQKNSTTYTSEDEKLNRLKKRKKENLELLDKAISEKWDDVFDQIIKIKKNEKKAKGVKFGSINVKDAEIKNKYSKIGYYLDASNSLKKKVKATYSLKDALSRGFSEEFTLLFENFRFNLLVNLLKNKSNEISLDSVITFLLNGDTGSEKSKQNIKSMLFDKSFFENNKVFKRAQGLSRDAKLILWRLCYSKNNLHKIGDMENYSRVLAYPIEAVLELNNKNLIIMSDEFEIETLLKSFTLKELKKTFYRDDITWSGNKKRKINAIIDSYEERDIRKRAQSNIDDLLIKRTWDYDPVLDDLVNAQKTLIESLIDAEEEKIKNSENKAKESLINSIEQRVFLNDNKELSTEELANRIRER
ncbi:MAG: hypothetical protein V5A57_03130 [Candidatus Paceibacterota bacterium]